MATKGSTLPRANQKKPPAGPSSKTTSDRGVDKCEVFYGSLSDKLNALEQAVQPKWLTLEWVSLAVDFMRSTFSDMMILFEDVRALMPDVKVSDEFWIEEYMVESMKLLDVCNVLKPAVSRFEHFMMCVQLVVQTVQRCSGGSQEFASDKTLMVALQSCEAELNQLVHLPLALENSAQSSSTQSENELRPTESPLRHASIALGEKFSVESININSASAQPSPVSRNGRSKSGRGTVALTLVMRATRETTDFVASVLIWALKRDPSSHPASTVWQQNLEVFRGDEALWSPSFRRLQERLRKELFEILRDERSAPRRQFRQFTFEELKLVEECTADLRAEVEELAERGKSSGAQPTSLQFLENLAQDLTNLFDKIQTRLEKVSSQVNQLFDELVQARKKLLDAAQRPGTIHRTLTF
ncbi:hypothetical protein M758_12G191100 [Ceratodon purpureus]|nr:hypothetical protein M758_12G191100 [Ceratodon purpureus]KAG0599961.1 hypothetical protein M758_12G191100 [Ceratodon purpureus]